MGYIGNQQTEGYSQVPPKQDLTGATGSTLTLTHAVASAEGIDLFINNVRQEPTESYSVGGDGVTVTLNGYTVAATDDIYVVYNSLARQTSTHPSNQALQATSGTFSSGISATTGTFSGGLSATTGTFSGAVSSTDLTLSGGLYVGGTGSANYLNDYEEGTFTLAIGGSTTNPTTPVTTTGHYTKVGSIVYCDFQFVAVNLSGASGGFRIDGWPFTPAKAAAHGAFVGHTGFTYPANAKDAVPYFVSSTQLAFYATQSNAPWTEVSINGTTNVYLYGSITYRTS